MKNRALRLAVVLGLAALFACATGAEPQQPAGVLTWPPHFPAGVDLSWAFSVGDKVQPPPEDPKELKHLPGSAKTYTQPQIDDLLSPPDWFPEQHPPMPKVVQSGSGKTVLACAACHLASGLGHPESAMLAGQAAPYLIRQLLDFKAGGRIDAARMTNISKNMSDDEIREASRWFAALPTEPWVKVVETATVPKTYVNGGRMRLPWPGGPTEPIGKRIITIPLDVDRTIKRDPHSGFVAYVPMGSIARGRALVTTGGGGKTMACANCHNPALHGLGQVPRIAGLSPVYIVRQIYNVQMGLNGSSQAMLMKPVVAHLNEDDIIAIAAYVSSLP